MQLDVVNFFGGCEEPIEERVVDSGSSLPPEVEEGNVEYKLKLVDPSKCRFEHLVTQMKWRLEEGHGEAIYQIGVEDSGMMTGLDDDELRASLATLGRMAERLGASVSVLRRCSVESDAAEASKYTAEALVRKVPNDQKFLDVRVAVLGAVESGKSTLIGVLTHGEMDNGRGRSRLNLFRHLHEIQSGRTSSISHEIVGFNSRGEVVNYSESRSAEEICKSASKLVTFVDLAGHHRYMRTTIFGLTCYRPDFAMLVVSANAGLIGTAREHLGFAVALGIPVCVVMTKVDVCTPTMTQKAIDQVTHILQLPGCNKNPIVVKTEADVIRTAYTFKQESITPIFVVSNVTGHNLELLYSFLNLVPSVNSAAEQEKLEQEALEFQVDETFSVPETGTVVGGKVLRGAVRLGDKALIGPQDNGMFSPITIGSVHRNRSPCRFARAGQAATLALLDTKRSCLRKGMVILSREQKKPRACWRFESEIFMLYHNSVLRPGFEATVHVGGVMQTARVTRIYNEEQALKTGNKGQIELAFIKQPEYLTPNARLLFRGGQFKAIGQVKRVLHDEEGLGAEQRRRAHRHSVP